jgi:acyl phosphate:glycerol-3-phosphate acyltransferase
MHPLVGAMIAYALGSVPAAYLAGKWKRVDLRKHGSGNLGATNVWRVLGWKIGLAVFVFDALKGAVPVLFFPPWTQRTLGPELTVGPEVLGIIYGFAAIAGHARPIWLRFSRGGKGVATSAGVFFALAPVPMLITFGVFATVLLASGYVSLGSLTAAVVLPVVLAVTRGVQSPVFVLSVVLALFVFWTHRANIGRLRRGEEHRFGRKKAAG